MDTENEPSHDVAFAIAIVMRENGIRADAAAKLIEERARALGVTLEDVAATIVEIGYSDRREDNLRDWLHRRE